MGSIAVEKFLSVFIHNISWIINLFGEKHIELMLFYQFHGLLLYPSIDCIIYIILWRLVYLLNVIQHHNTPIIYINNIVLLDRPNEHIFKYYQCLIICTVGQILQHLNSNSSYLYLFCLITDSYVKCLSCYFLGFVIRNC